jgi:general stress protein CsbA
MNTDEWIVVLAVAALVLGYMVGQAFQIRRLRQGNDVLRAALQLRSART